MGLDLSELEKSYCGSDSASYHPAFPACWIGAFAGLWMLRDAMTYPEIGKLSRLR